MYISDETKDGFACILTAFVVIIILVAIFHLCFYSEGIYVGRVVSIDVESTGGQFGSIRYYCLLDTGQTHSFISPKRIGESIYIPKLKLRILR